MPAVHLKETLSVISGTAKGRSLRSWQQSGGEV